MSIDEIIEQLEKAGFGEADIIGCTDSEVRAIESNIGHTLPKAYCEFLLKFGRRAGPLLSDIGMSYEGIPRSPLAQNSIRERVERELRASGSGATLPEKTFFFGDAQGYFYYFFNLDDKYDDPAVYGAGDESSFVQVVAWSFTDLFLESIEDILQL